MPAIRCIPIDTHPENTVFMLRDGKGYSPEQFQALRRVRVFSQAREILATLAIVDDENLIGEGQIGLGEQAFRRLGCEEGSEVAIEQARPPASRIKHNSRQTSAKAGTFPRHRGSIWALARGFGYEIEGVRTCVGFCFLWVLPSPP